MSRQILSKTYRNLLTTGFPENFTPSRKCNLKLKRLITKLKPLSIYKKIRKLQYNSIDNLSNVALANKKNVKFLYDTHQIKNIILYKNPQQKNQSQFKLQLKSRKKLSILYGNLSQRYLKKLYKQAVLSKGKNDINLLLFLESRLDVVLYRICFFNSIMSARQAINHNNILVNNIVINIASYQLKPGDIISLNPKKSIIFREKISKYIYNIISRPRDRFMIDSTLLSQYDNNLKNQIINLLKSRLDNSRHYSMDKKTRNSFLKALFLTRKAKNKYDFLSIKKYLMKKRSRYQILLASRISCMKPLNVEVSYKLFRAIFLYSPQKITYPGLLDLDYIIKGLK